jgi:hypothetical protein
MLGEHYNMPKQQLTDSQMMEKDLSDSFTKHHENIVAANAQF